MFAFSQGPETKKTNSNLISFVSLQQNTSETVYAFDEVGI